MFSRVLGLYSAFVYGFLFAPIVIVVIYAFNAGTNVAEWGGFSTRWFAVALADESITSAIGRSLIVGAGSMVVSTVLGTAAALALARAGRRLRAGVDALAFLTLVVPELVIAVSLLIFFVNAGFELGPVPMVLGHSGFGASLVMIIVRARYAGMGSVLEEASADLGAGPVRTFVRITLVRLAPAVVAGALLSFTLSFDDVVISQFTSGAGHQTWPLRVLAGLRFGLRPDLNAAAALMLAVTLLGFALAAIVLRVSSPSVNVTRRVPHVGGS